MSNSQNRPDDQWMRARKKPVIVEFQGPFTDPEIVETLEGDFEITDEYLDEHGAYVVIRGVEGELYPCALDVFKQTYEPNPACQCAGPKRTLAKGTPGESTWCQECGLRVE